MVEVVRQLRLETSQFHEVTQKPHFERCIAVDRNGYADRATSLDVNVMASTDSLQRPTVRLQQACKLLAGKRLHSANSIT